uniref:Uncharacterized protein n=1 Tax=Cyprinus carpio TaxID=7962 RepID=A0A8C1GWF0_CYPCA
MESDCSDTSSFATERSFEVEDFSSPPSPEVEDVDVSVDTGPGPELYQFEPLAQTAVLNPASRSASDSLQGQHSDVFTPYIVELKHFILKSLIKPHSYRSLAKKTLRTFISWVSNPALGSLPSCRV